MNNFVYFKNILHYFAWNYLFIFNLNIELYSLEKYLKLQSQNLNQSELSENYFQNLKWMAKKIHTKINLYLPIFLLIFVLLFSILLCFSFSGYYHAHVFFWFSWSEWILIRQNLYFKEGDYQQQDSFYSLMKSSFFYLKIRNYLRFVRNFNRSFLLKFK